MTLYNVIEPWLFPPGINILLAIIGIFFCYYSKWIYKFFILMSILSLWLASMPIVAYNLLDLLQNQNPPLTLKELKAKSVIVVLGGGDSINVEQGNKHTVSVITLNRLNFAADLHKKTNLPIIVSGGYTKGSAESESDLMANVLKENFNIFSVIKENKSLNTMEESKYLVPILKQNHFDVIYLVTNAWHMPRSIYAFKSNGIQVIPAPMGYEVYDHHYTILSFLPNVRALTATTIAMHEFIGLLWYRKISS